LIIVFSFSCLGCHESDEEKDEFIELYKGMKDGRNVDAVMEIIMIIWHKFKVLELAAKTFAVKD